MSSIKKKASTTDYHLDVLIGKDRLPLEAQHIREFYIVLDIDKFLPSVRMKLMDTSKVLSNIVPFDTDGSTLTVRLSNDSVPENATEFIFKLYRKFPNSNDIYDVAGLLDVPKLFSPSNVKGYSGSVRDTLESIAINDLKLDETDISPSLSLSKDLLQPSISTGEFLTGLKSSLVGNLDTSGYFCYIQCNGKKKKFVFKSIAEFYSAKIKYSFINTFDPSYDSTSGKTKFPILEYKAYDNYKILGISGTRQVDYSYFDTVTGKYIYKSLKVQNNTDPLDDYFSLTPYFSINIDDSTDNINIPHAGRNTDYALDCKGCAKNILHKKINNLSKFWLTSLGLEDIYPGDIVTVQFLDVPSALTSHQYNGFWMVERVVHLIGRQFNTRLLLTRNGVNTSEASSLMPVNTSNIKIK